MKMNELSKTNTTNNFLIFKLYSKVILRKISWPFTKHTNICIYIYIYIFKFWIAIYRLKIKKSSKTNTTNEFLIQILCCSVISRKIWALEHWFLRGGLQEPPPRVFGAQNSPGKIGLTEDKLFRSTSKHGSYIIWTFAFEWWY